MSQLFVAKYLKDMQYGKPHPLTGKREGQFSIVINGGVRLVFEAVEPIPTALDGSTDWGKVTAINVVFIGDYHA